MVRLTFAEAVVFVACCEYAAGFRAWSQSTNARGMPIPGCWAAFFV